MSKNQTDQPGEDYQNNRIDNLVADLKALKADLQRSRVDRAWEQSWIRRILLGVLTYLFTTAFLLIGEFPNPFTSALLPVLGLFLSSLSLSEFKLLWVRHVYTPKVLKERQKEDRN